MAINFQFPTFSEDMLDTEKGRKQLLEALYQLTRQLKWVLSNLGEENFSEEYKETNDLSAVNEKITSNTASIRQLSGRVNNAVQKASIIRSVNDSPETEKVEAERIANLAGQNLKKNNYTGTETIHFLGIDGEGNLIVLDTIVLDATTGAASEQYSISAAIPE